MTVLLIWISFDLEDLCVAFLCPKLYVFVMHSLLECTRTVRAMGSGPVHEVGDLIADNIPALSARIRYTTSFQCSSRMMYTETALY